MATSASPSILTRPVLSRFPATPNPLTEEEILEFFQDLDPEKTGHVTFQNLERRLKQVHQEFDNTSSSNYLYLPALRLPNSQDRDVTNVEDGTSGAGTSFNEYLHDLFATSASQISKDKFLEQVRTWRVPSASFLDAADASTSKARKKQHIPLIERLRVRWLVEGPRIVLITFIIALQLAFGVWQMVRYICSPLNRAAFGWGVIVSKTAAGAIYPTLFFMILSMSRYFATLMRRFKYVPRLINWDRSQSTHVWLAAAGLVLATLHAIGYLTGSFLYSSRPAQQDNLARVIGPERVPRSYGRWVRTLPSWTGLAALGMYWIMALTSLPIVRAWSYESFQLSHLLMFPFIGLLCAHGTSAIFQNPMLGYWLAFPTLLVMFERSTRIAHGLRRVPARLQILDEDTVTITFDHPRGNWWNYEAGQYVLLQVPGVSFFQWHPFTISSCVGKRVQVHIRTRQGDWTGRLRSLPTDEDIRIGVDGPFGAPSQRFYEFDRALIIGAGVGITPFSAIITDLEQKLGSSKDPWHKLRRSERQKSHAGSEEVLGNEEKAEEAPRRSLSVSKSLDCGAVDDVARPERRIDFHWMIRGRNDLQWFSSLLNRAHDVALGLPSSYLKLNIKTHITARRQDISTHVFRYVLDAYHTPSYPYSALTGLKFGSQFGRPDLTNILRDFDADMERQAWTGGRVGVFFCGSPSIGTVLADACSKLTARSRRDGGKIRYIFIMEVFG